MSRETSDIKWHLMAIVAVAIAAMFFLARHRLDLETDITSGLPQDDPVLADARYILSHYPVFERIVIDVSLQAQEPDRERLNGAANFMEQGLLASGLFRQVGTQDVNRAIPALIGRIAASLPILFDAQTLEGSVAGLLAPEEVRNAMEQDVNILGSLEGIGQAELISRDPLALRNIVLARFADLLPRQDVNFYRGHVFSADWRHVLLTAQPEGAAVESVFAHKVQALIEELSGRLNEELAGDGSRFIVSPVGSYRAAVDNEDIVKRDTKKAVLLATIGIAVLLLIGFPRRFIGLLALIPALAGTVCSLFVISLFTESISILAVGFGGAIIAITVDHGIAFFLFLDRDTRTYGRQASREIWALGLVAALTTAGAFLALTFSGFKILAEVGLFAALGVVFSFLFIHTVFSRIFVSLAPARRSSLVPLERIASGAAIWMGWPVFIAALVFGAAMLSLAKPVFRADLKAMNTVSPETLRAEQQIKDTWGDVFANAYLLIQADSLEGLRSKADRLDGFLEDGERDGSIESAFSLSQVFPGNERAQNNLDAWREFWNTERIGAMTAGIEESTESLGFAPDAFSSFIAAVSSPELSEMSIPEDLYPMLGITRSDRDGRWMMISTVRPGPNYCAESFYEQLADRELGTILDARLYSQRLSELLRGAYVRMVAIIGIGVVIILVLFFLDLKLVLAALAPICFSMVSTLGTLKLLGRPLDVPGLMLAIVVFGMGIDYALFFIRAHQRYFNERHALMGPVRAAVLLSAGSTMIGLGVLAGSEHALLSSAGLTTVLGIGYALIGAYVLLPPVLRRLFADPRPPGTEALTAGSRKHRKAVLSRYRHMSPYVRMFARFKMLTDPMFPGLAELVAPDAAILDIGCGYGVPALWLKTLYPGLKVLSVDPDPERVRITGRVLFDLGDVCRDGAPDLASAAKPIDTALMIDIVHYLSDDELRRTLARLSELLDSGGRIVLRATVPSPKRIPWERWLERTKLRAARIDHHFRGMDVIQTILAETGFILSRDFPAARSREETWFVAVLADERPELN